jgi:hypothetical protein
VGHKRVFVPRATVRYSKLQLVRALWSALSGGMNGADLPTSACRNAKPLKLT